MVVGDLLNELESLADEKIAATSTRFFKTNEGEYGHGDKFYGIRNPQLRQLAKTYWQLPTDDVFNLMSHEYHETRLVAVFILVAQYQKNKNPESRQYITDLYIQHSAKFNNWDLVDSSAYKILGPQLFKQDRSVLYRLAKSTNLWQRRIAIISTMFFIKKVQYDDTLKLCELLMNDSEDLIHKACGWMLREVGNRNKEVEISFLDQYAHQLPRTMLRYAIEKFDKVERQHYLLKKS